MAGYIDALRSTLAELIGEPDNATPFLPEGLPESLRATVGEAVHGLIAYQGPGYAQLYLDRLRRFIGRRDVDDAVLGDIARLMMLRMCYEDPIRIAQLTLEESDRSARGRPARRVERNCRFRLDELITALPEMLADPLIDAFDFFGWMHKPVTMRFSTNGWFGVRRLKLEASLRRWRLLSVRYPKERAWVERWLHMIDRCLVKQPRSVGEIVRTAQMPAGYGDRYRQGLADWHMVIDGLAKPAFDGQLPLPDLAAAIVEARAAAVPDPQQVALRRAVAAIRARATGVEAGSAC